MPTGPEQARDQLIANLSELPHHASFEEHRRELTALALEAAVARTEPSLCVLGAGNCFDLDLNSLAERFASIHLVDIDASALERAFELQQPATRTRLVLHGPVDLSGLLDRIDRWARFQVTPDEVMGHPERTAASLRDALAGRFDVVLSACVLSQMQLSVLNVLTDRHRLFEAVRSTLTLTHLRTLAALTLSGGTALFATDVSSSQLYPLSEVPVGADCSELLEELVHSGRVFDFADPKQISALLTDDPSLRRAFAEFGVRKAWLWTNGPEARFLVYASALARA